jgi:NTP pyrophosphatase (non-canonical NTP hydrolase)
MQVPKEISKTVQINLIPPPKTESKEVYMKYKIIAGHSNSPPESMEDEANWEFFDTIYECEEWIHNEVDYRIYNQYMLHLDVDTEEELDKDKEVEYNLMTIIHQSSGDSVPFYHGRRKMSKETLNITSEGVVGVKHTELRHNFDDEFGDIEAVEKEYNRKMPATVHVNTPEEVESLVILMEECGEVIQEASKLIRFPENMTERLAKEIGDLQCIMDIACSIHDINPMDVMRFKREKRIKLETYSNLV